MWCRPAPRKATAKTLPALRAVARTGRKIFERQEGSIQVVRTTVLTWETIEDPTNDSANGHKIYSRYPPSARTLKRLSL